MSAWIVSKNHIDLLITAALAWEIIVQERADATGRMLWVECRASVAYLYPHMKDDLPGPVDLTEAEMERYAFEALEGRIDPEVVHVAARSLAYQSCKHPGWDGSAAARLVAELMTAAEKMVERYRIRWGEMPEQALRYGPENAWSTDSRTILLHAEQVRAHSRGLTAAGR